MPKKCEWLNACNFHVKKMGRTDRTNSRILAREHMRMNPRRRKWIIQPWGLLRAEDIASLHFQETLFFSIAITLQQLIRDIKYS
jgi:hypothetical protein